MMLMSLLKFCSFCFLETYAACLSTGTVHLNCTILHLNKFQIKEKILHVIIKSIQKEQKMKNKSVMKKKKKKFENHYQTKSNSNSIEVADSGQSATRICHTFANDE